ncbi:MAG TPA: kelch repeat-containing protein [Chitinophagaceae bacterium]|jgi:N-acetylneuraminic acid mutarotase|nr:kelch repeat-containing protein [Chitinophagaceae bacterium]
MRKMKVYVVATLLITTSFLITQSCVKSNDDSDEDVIGNWIRSSDFDGNARSEAATFVIGDYAYLATGSTDRERFKDLWEYNLSRQYWSQKADLPGVARNSAVAFTIGSKGYIGTGYDGANKLNDFWEYDPTLNQWTQKADFGGTARYDAIGFSVNDKGYISCGFDGNYLKDLWQYDPSSNQWSQKASIGGTKRSAASVFVINNKAYICSGNNNGSALNDLWMYDASSDNWTEKRKLSNVSDESYDDDYSNIARYNGVVVVMNNYAYLTTGENGSIISNTWMYDPTSDVWTKKTAFEGTARTGAAAFSLSDRGFVLTGRSGSLSFDNAYEFHPADEQNDNDN